MEPLCDKFTVGRDVHFGFESSHYQTIEVTGLWAATLNSDTGRTATPGVPFRYIAFGDASIVPANVQ